MPRPEAESLIDADFRPPASQGDILEALADRPSAIGLVDGLFGSVAAVWHSEILYAIEQGVPVLGASSIGALRAAELAGYGVEGVGLVYEAYRRGWLEDDDEVAVTHAPRELGWRPLSEAMVNIRVTLRAASRRGVLEAREARWLTDIAKRTHYTERSYDRLLDAAFEAGWSAARIDLARAWLSECRIDRKRADCRLLLRRMARRGGSWPAPRVVHRVERTRAFLEALNGARGRASRTP